MASRATRLNPGPLGVTRHTFTWATSSRMAVIARAVLGAHSTNLRVDGFALRERPHTVTCSASAALFAPSRRGRTFVGVRAQLQLAPDANRCFTVLQGLSLSARGSRR